jgi:hypothetical protein
VSTWQNLVVRIALPANLALTDKSVMGEEVTFEVTGTITPWYCSIDQVRLEGGAYLRNLSDLTIAAMIYQAGRDCDAITYMVPPPGPGGETVQGAADEQYMRFNLARQRYTQLTATRNLILNLWDVNMNRGTKTLANFSVSQSSQTKDEEVPKKLTQIQKDIAEWAIVVKSGGNIGRGGRAQSRMAAKNIYGDRDFPAGRTWVTTGMGANEKSFSGFGSNGKPVKFGSPSVMQYRLGLFLGGAMMSRATFRPYFN